MSRLIWHRIRTTECQPTTAEPQSLLDYTISQMTRTRIEEGFGWMKAVGRQRKTMCRGVEKIAKHVDLHVEAYPPRMNGQLGLVPLGWHLGPQFGPHSGLSKNKSHENSGYTKHLKVVFEKLSCFFNAY